VLEVNAFGDLLPGVLCDGRDTYEDELWAMRDAWRSNPSIAPDCAEVMA
jgi:hypothetical protein